VQLPTIDLSDPDAMVAKALDRTYREVGFASVVNHGIGSEKLAAIFAASRSFHALEQSAKMRIELNDHHRGFIARGTSTDAASEYEKVTAPNQSESFMMLGPVTAGSLLDGPNQWPALEGFQTTVLDYHAAMTSLGLRLVRCFSLSMGYDLAPLFETPTAWLRLLRYPPLPADVDAYGSAPHRDYGALTLLAQQDVPGLEVLTPAGDWIEVGADPAALILNTGEVMHRWSNGQLLRTPHRVRNRSGQERFSIPFFFDPSMDTIIEPLEATMQPGEPPAFAPMSFEDFVRSELQAGYDHHDGEPPTQPIL